jgi:transcriptional regulator with XRE-family HTH domain
MWSMPHEEAQRLLSLLRVAMRMLDVSNREIEKKLGLSYGYLSRLFSGSIELKVEHILQILEILGLTPGEFFQLAYPRRNTPPSEAANRIRSLLDGLGPLPPEEPPTRPTMTREEMEEIIAATMRRLLKEIQS